MSKEWTIPGRNCAAKNGQSLNGALDFSFDTYGVWQRPADSHFRWHAIRSLLALDLSDVAIARVAHRAETEFVGAPVGIMDQMVCALGRPGFAFFLDTATL